MDDNRNYDQKKAAGAVMQALGGKPSESVQVEIDEIQTPRKHPRRTAEVDKLIAANPSLGRAWERMEKNYKDNPYQELPKVGQGNSVIKRAIEGLNRHMTEQDPLIKARDEMDTTWIYGRESRPAIVDVSDALVLERPAAPKPASKPSAADAPEKLAFLAFDKRDGVLTIELAWSVQSERGTRHLGEVIELRSGDPKAIDQMRVFREKVEGKRVNIWDIPPFFQAMDEFMAPEFEPLHLWLKATGLMRFSMGLYSVDEVDRERLSLGCLCRRFVVSLEEHRKNKNAFMLLRLRSMMDGDLINRAKNKPVAPLELDA